MNSPLFKTSFAIPQPNAAIAPQSVCPSTLPLVLLPVRLETRFFKLAGGVIELRIRIYPDRIHTDSHQPELTTDERTWGMQYWRQDWVAGPDADGSAGYYLVLQEHPTEPRFGINNGTAPPGANYLTVGGPLPTGVLAWGTTSAAMAALTRRRPARVAIHAKRLINPAG